MLWDMHVSNSNYFTHFYVLSRTRERHIQPRLVRRLPRYKLHQELFFLSFSFLILSNSSMILILSSFGIEVKIFVVLASGKFIRCRARRRIAAFVLISITLLQGSKWKIVALLRGRWYHPQERLLTKKTFYLPYQTYISLFLVQAHLSVTLVIFQPWPSLALAE